MLPVDGTVKPLVWIHGEIKSPPFSLMARIKAGRLLQEVQNGKHLGMPVSRPRIGPGCHELRIQDGGFAWRVVYGIGGDSIAVLDVFAKKTLRTPDDIIARCRRRWADYCRTE